MEVKLRRLLRKPSPGTVIATLALFVALSGVGYAAATIGTRDIKNGAVTSKKIRNNTVRSRDIRNRTIRKKDMSRGTVASLSSRWALVAANGTILRQSGGISLASHP